MEHYELMYIIPAKYTTEELEPIYQKVRSTIEEADGSITDERMLRKQRLAYPIGKATVGYYVVAELDLAPDRLTKFQGELQLMPDILRSLIVKKQKMTPEQIKKDQIIYERIAREESKTKGETDTLKEMSELKGLTIPILKKEEPSQPEVLPSAPKEATKAEENVLPEENVTKAPTAEQAETEEPKESPPHVKKPTKVRLEELDKKLDEILEDEI